MENINIDFDRIEEKEFSVPIGGELLFNFCMFKSGEEYAPKTLIQIIGRYYKAGEPTTKSVRWSGRAKGNVYLFHIDWHATSEEDTDIRFRLISNDNEYPFLVRITED